MPKYVVQMSKEGGEAYEILDKTAREQIGNEATAREAAVSAEAAARDAAVSAEATAREAAVSAEAAARDASEGVIKRNIANNVSILPEEASRYDFFSKRAVWSLNRIDDDTGEDIDNGMLCRTDNYIQMTTPAAPVQYKFKNVNGNHAVAMYMYDESKQFIGYVATVMHSGDYSGQLETNENTKYVRFVVWKQGQPIFNSINDVLDHVDIYQNINNYDLHDVPFTIGIGIICETDLSGYRTLKNEKYAVSDFIPIGKGTTFDTKWMYGLPADQIFRDLFYIYTYDADYNLTGYMNPDDWGNHWEAANDCYIRMVVRYSTTLNMTSEFLNATLDRIVTHYIPPKNTEYSFKTNKSFALSLDDFTVGISLWSQATESGFNEDEFNNPARMTSTYFPVGKGTLISVSPIRSEADDAGSKLVVYQYDKNFKFKAETSDWSCDDVIHQDGYARIILRRTGNTPMSESDPAWLLDKLSIKYVQPGDADLMESLAVRREKALGITMHDIYDDRLNEVRAKYNGLAEPGRLGYIWASDIHIDGEKKRQSYRKMIVPRILKAVKEAAEMNGLDFICIGGDLYDESNISEDDAYEMISDVLAPLRDSSVPVIVLFGNHDNNVYGKWNTDRYAIEIPHDQAMALVPQQSKFYNNIQFADISAGHFYFDIPAKKKRIVCLNGNEPENNMHTSGWWCINRAQVEWFCQTASDTPNDIIILTHTPPGTQYGFYGMGDDGGYYTDLGNAITAYNARTSITLYGQTYDFSNAEGHVKYIHCGHTHFDLDPTVEPFTWGGVPVIVTSCVKAWGQTVGENEATEVTPGSDLWYYTEAQAETARANTYGWKFYLWTNRKYWTIKESLFDVVSVNSDVVHTFRIGAGVDRDFNFE